MKSTPPNPISLRSILILSPHPRPVIPSGFVPSGFLIKTVYACLFFHTRTTCPDKEIFLDLLSLCCYFPSCSIGETPVTNQFTEPFFSSRPWILKTRVATQISVARKLCRIVKYPSKNPSEFDGLYWTLIGRVVPSGLQRHRDLRFWDDDRKVLEPLFLNTFLSRDSKKGSTISFQYLHFRLHNIARRYYACDKK